MWRLVIVQNLKDKCKTLKIMDIMEIFIFELRDIISFKMMRKSSLPNLVSIKENCCQNKSFTLYEMSEVGLKLDQIRSTFI